MITIVKKFVSMHIFVSSFHFWREQTRLGASGGRTSPEDFAIFCSVSWPDLFSGLSSYSFLIEQLYVGSLLKWFQFALLPQTFAIKPRQKYVSWYRLGGLIIGSLMCTTAASTIAITGGGYLATVIMAFIATTGWRLTAAKFDVSFDR